ncbi:MAG: prolyl oligopeptidase family serine peptidase [Bryobacterales bacterium]|nr:prolyl oligopeptidase family serine peptidase [Bryobacterales bacterium]
MGLPHENSKGYERSSPIGKAKDLEAKLLIVHNLSDDNVHFQNAVQMGESLARAGKVYDLTVYPQRTHHVTGPERRHMLETMTEFFERELKR